MKSNINSNEIKGKFKVSNGKTYIFFTNGKVFEEDASGNLKEVNLQQKSNIEKIRSEIGSGSIDIER